MMTTVATSTSNEKKKKSSKRKLTTSVEDSSGARPVKRRKQQRSTSTSSSTPESSSDAKQPSPSSVPLETGDALVLLKLPILCVTGHKGHLKWAVLWYVDTSTKPASKKSIQRRRAIVQLVPAPYLAASTDAAVHLRDVFGQTLSEFGLAPDGAGDVSSDSETTDDDDDDDPASSESDGEGKDGKTAHGGGPRKDKSTSITGSHFDLRWSSVFVASNQHPAVPPAALPYGLFATMQTAMAYVHAGNDNDASTMRTSSTSSRTRPLQTWEHFRFDRVLPPQRGASTNDSRTAAHKQRPRESISCHGQFLRTGGFINPPYISASAVERLETTLTRTSPAPAVRSKRIAASTESSNPNAAAAVDDELFFLMLYMHQPLFGMERPLTRCETFSLRRYFEPYTIVGVVPPNAGGSPAYECRWRVLERFASKLRQKADLSSWAPVATAANVRVQVLQLKCWIDVSQERCATVAESVLREWKPELLTGFMGSGNADRVS